MISPASPDRLKLVLRRLFFVEELNLTEIAAVLEVPRCRGVLQLRAKGLKGPPRR